MSALTLAELQRLSKNTTKPTTISPTPTTEIATLEKLNTPVVSLAPLKKNKTALEALEYSVGGREAVIDTIELGALDKKQQHFLDLLSDPKRKRDTISTIARDAGLTAVQVLELFRSASFAKANALAMAKMAEAAPAIVDDIASKSVDAKIECPTCFGTKTIADSVPCPHCFGKGEIMRPSDLDRQKIILESTGISKKQGGVNVNVNTQVGVVSPGSFFSNYVKSSDKAAYDVEAVDITPEEPKE